MCIDAKSQNTIEPFFKGEASSRYDLNVQFANASKKWKKEDFRLYISKLYDRILAYEEKAKIILEKKTTEISSLEKDIEDLEGELERTKRNEEILQDSLVEATVSMVNARESISLLKDSLAYLKDSLAYVSVNTPYTVESVNSKDYLNQYAKSGTIPEDETILTLEPHRIMLMHGFTPNYDGNVMFNYKSNSIDFGYGPELLSPHDIVLNKISSIASKEDWYWNDILEQRRSMSWTNFNSFFPKIELTKGKFLTFKGGMMGNTNVTDFIVKSSESYNAGKRIYHWKLTEGQQSSVNDLTLDIYEVEGEFYLALDMSQLMRFGFWVISPYYGLIRPSNKRQSYHNSYRNYDNTIFSNNVYFYDDFTYWEGNQEIKIPSKPSVIFSRKNPDTSNTLANTMIEPMNMIFLFKLKEE